MRPRSRPVLVRSVTVLRAIFAGITLASLGGMTAYATDHLHADGAPLKPNAVVAPAATPTAQPTAATRTRTTLRQQVPTTTRTPLTRTRQSG